MALSSKLKIGKTSSLLSMKQIIGAKKSMASICIALLISTVLFSCNKSSTDSNETTKEVEEEIILDSALMIPDFALSIIQDSADFSNKDLNTEGIILIKYFSPDCDHCQDEATMYVSKKDSLQNIKTIWVSGDWASLKMINEFHKNYQLEQLAPLAIGKDNASKLLSYYKISGVPFAAIYQDNQLVKEYRGALDFSELIAINNGTFVPDTVDTTLQKEQEISTTK